MPMLVHDFMQRAVARHGDRPALVDSYGKLSYNELWERSGAIGRRPAVAWRGQG